MLLRDHATNMFSPTFFFPRRGFLTAKRERRETPGWRENARSCSSLFDEIVLVIVTTDATSHCVC